MSEMLSTIQGELLTIFRNARSNKYPAEVAGYGGQLKDPDAIDQLPALYVDVPSGFQINSPDGGFELMDMQGNPEVVLFAENQASEEANRTEIAKLADWVIDTLQGTEISVNNVPIPLSGISGTILTGYGKHGKIAAAVLRLEFMSFQD